MVATAMFVGEAPSESQGELLIESFSFFFLRPEVKSGHASEKETVF